MWFDRSAGIVFDLVELGGKLADVKECNDNDVQDPSEEEFWVMRECYSPTEDDMVDRGQAQRETVTPRL